MGHKINPLGFRVGITEPHRSNWYAKGKKYSQMVLQDHKIRTFLKERFISAAVEKIQIERKADRVVITMHAARPGVIIGKRGAEIESLTKHLETIASTGVKVNIQEVQNPDQNAQVVVRGIIDQIQKRLPFRRVMKHSVEQIMRSGAQGAKVILAGRLNGAEIARTEKLSTGKIPLQTLRADIDYARGAAHTTYGAIGVKVWVHKGEVFEEKKRANQA